MDLIADSIIVNFHSATAAYMKTTIIGKNRQRNRCLYVVMFVLPEFLPMLFLLSVPALFLARSGACVRILLFVYFCISVMLTPNCSSRCSKHVVITSLLTFNLCFCQWSFSEPKKDQPCTRGRLQRRWWWLSRCCKIFGLFMV